MDQGDFSVTVRRTDTEAVVSPVGEVDVSSVGELAGRVEELLVDAPPRIVIDMGGVTFCDSQGLGTLVALSQKARMAHSVLVLTNVRAALHRVLDITGLRAVLVIG